MPNRVLLIAEDANVQHTGSVILRKEGFEVVLATDAADGMRRWASDQPDLVVVDSALSTSDGLSFVRGLRAAEAPPARVPVIVLGMDVDIESKISALRAGGDDYVAKPLNQAELVARVGGLMAQVKPVESVSPPAAPVAAGRVLAWYGAKGGVGSTTLAINTAIALRRETRQPVVLVDAVLQLGDHRVFLDMGANKNSIVDPCTAPTIDHEVLRNSLVRHDSGVDFLLSPPQPEGAEHVRAEHHHLLQVVEALRASHEFVLVDLERRLDDHTLDVFSSADTVMMVLNADLSSLKNMRLLLGTFDQLGMSADRVELVLNRSNAHTGISIDAAERVLPHKINHSVPNDYRTAIGSLNSGTPFMVNKPDSTIGKAVSRLTRSIIGPAPKIETAPRAGLLGGRQLGTALSR